MQYYEIQEQELIEYIDRLFMEIRILLYLAYKHPDLFEFPAEEGGE